MADPTQRPERDKPDAGDSWLGELSPVTLLVAAIIVLVVAGYGLLLILELFL
jgi:hypothetical protein